MSNAGTGRTFENLFQRLCQFQGIAITRVPDGCRQLGKQIIRVKTPWDFVLTHQTKTAMIDTKTCEDSKFRNSMIVRHQIDSMLTHSKNGGLAGYVIWFRKTHEMVFIAAPFLLQFSKIRGSFSATSEGCQNLGNLTSVDFRKIFQ